MPSSKRKKKLPDVRDLRGIRRHDGRKVRLHGNYQAIEMPSKRPAKGPVPKEYARILLRDGTEVLIEAYNTPAAERPAAEIEQHDGGEVRVTGVVYEVVPTGRQAPDLPGILDVESIEAVDPPDRLDSQQKGELS